MYSDHTLFKNDVHILFFLFGFYNMITFLELANKWNLSQIELTLFYNLTTLEYFERHVFHER